MSAWSDLPAAAGEKLGLIPRPDKKVAYGDKAGFLVQLAIVQAGNAEFVQEIVRFGDAARDEAVRQAIDESTDLAERGVKAKAVVVKDGMAVYRHLKKIFRTPAPEEIAGEVEAILRVVKGAVPHPPATCRLCDRAAEPLLLDGLVDRVCAGCIERLQHEAKRAAEEYERKPLNLPLAIVAAAVLAVVGAAAWAAVTIGTGKMYWALGVGIGLLIGYGTHKAAGKGGLPVQVLAAVFTILSALLGVLFTGAYHYREAARNNGVEVDWGVFFANSIELLKAEWQNTLVALAAGVFGALVAIRIASKPKHEVKIERR
jgi:hypothetical protein